MVRSSSTHPKGLKKAPTIPKRLVGGTVGATPPFHWVIVGDVPPAVISPRFARNYVQALDGYVAEMTAWADAAEAGRPLDEFIPVAAAPTPDHIAMLRSRLAFITEHFIRPQERLLAAPVAADRREDAAGA